MLERPDFSVGQARSFKRLDSLGQLDAEPGIESLANSMNLAITRGRSERHSVEIVDNNPFSPGPGVRPLAIRLETSADNLTQFFHRGLRAAIRRMTKFLDLHSEGAAALDRHGQGKLGSDIEQDGFQQAVPLDGGILPGSCRAVEIAVFEK